METDKEIMDMIRRKAKENESTTVCIIPATADDMRMVDGEPLLRRALKRARACDAVDGVVIATTTGKREDAVARKCREWRAPYYRGGDDVLDRVYAAAVSYGASAVVCFPAGADVDKENIAWAVHRLRDAGSDYARSGEAEAFDINGLVRAWVDAKGEERGSPGAYIIGHRDEFSVECRETVPYPVEAPDAERGQ